MKYFVSNTTNLTKSYSKIKLFWLKKNLKFEGYNFDVEYSYKIFCSEVVSGMSSFKLNHALKSDSHFPKKSCFVCFIEILQKWWKKLFIYFKSSFRSEDILIFVVIIWSWRKIRSIRKIRLISKFMISQPG